MLRHRIGLAVPILMLLYAGLLTAQAFPPGPLTTNNIQDYVIYGAQKVFVGVGSIVNGTLVGSAGPLGTNGGVTVNASLVGGEDITGGNGVSYTGTSWATGNIKVGGTSTITGDIYAGGTIVFGSGTTQVGSKFPGYSPAPTMPTLPAPVKSLPFPGGADLATTPGVPLVLAPGNYGNITTGNSAKVVFQGAGDYTFKSFKANNNGLDLEFVGPGNIRIFVEGNMHLASALTLIISNSAKVIYTEVHGSSETYAFKIGGGAKWNGDVYAVNAGIVLGSGSGNVVTDVINGRLWAAGEIYVQHGITVNGGCKGSITIVKEVVGGAPATDWEFTGDLGTFTIPAGGGSKMFNGLGPGAYTVTETPKPGYTASSSCPPGTNVATLVIASCENLSCTFTNTKQCKGSITINKVVTAGTPVSDWQFTSDIPGHASFTLPAAGGTVTFADIDPNTYTVTEIAVPPFVTTNTCGTGNVATIVVSGCETKECTFTNHDPGLGCNCLDKFVLFALDQLNFKGRNTTGGIISGGSVGVNRCRPSSNSDFGTLTFGDKTVMPTDKTGVVGDHVAIDAAEGSDVYMVFANSLSSGFNTSVMRRPPVLPFTCPVYAALPALPPITPGATNIIVLENTTQSLSAGNYGDIKVNDGATLNLGAGIYNLKSFDCGKNVTINTVPGIELRIAGYMTFNNDCYFGPADDVLILLRSDGVASNNNTVLFSRRTEFHGQIYAPNGIMGLGHTTNLFGIFWAKSIHSDWNVTITCACTPQTSFFPDIPADILAKLQAFPKSSGEAIPVPLPEVTSLLASYPNPFNPTTEVSFQLADVSDVMLKVYDVLGREVATLVNETLEPGTYHRTFDAKGLVSGVYLVRIKAGRYSAVQKVMLVK